MVKQKLCKKKPLALQLSNTSGLNYLLSKSKELIEHTAA